MTYNSCKSSLTLQSPRNSTCCAHFSSSSSQHFSSDTRKELGAAWPIWAEVGQVKGCWGNSLWETVSVGAAIWKGSLLLSVVALGQLSTCLKMAFYALCSSPTQSSFTHMTIQFSSLQGLLVTAYILAAPDTGFPDNWWAKWHHLPVRLVGSSLKQ